MTPIPHPEFESNELVGAEVEAEVVERDSSEWLIHGLFFLLSSIVILASFVLKSDGLAGVYFPGKQLAIPKTCTSKIVLGIDCPGCGLTRAFIAISHGRMEHAWQLNRASFLMYAFVWGQIPWHGMQLLRLSRGRAPIFWPAIYWLPIGLVVLMALNWLLKITGVWV